MGPRRVATSGSQLRGLSQSRTFFQVSRNGGSRVFLFWKLVFADCRACLRRIPQGHAFCDAKYDSKEEEEAGENRAGADRYHHRYRGLGSSDRRVLANLPLELEEVGALSPFCAGSDSHLCREKLVANGSCLSE